MDGLHQRFITIKIGTLSNICSQQNFWRWWWEERWQRVCWSNTWEDKQSCYCLSDKASVFIGWEVWKQNFCPSHLKAFKWEAVRFICIKISAIKQNQFENFKTLIFHSKPILKQCIAMHITIYVYIALYTVQCTCIQYGDLFPSDPLLQIDWNEKEHRLLPMIL